MNDYGSPPAADEVEVTLFGPGFGEAVVTHLGDNQWMLVDSCIHPGSSVPASAHYLDSIGIAPERVRAIVASHWHQDHTRGMAQLATRYRGADFMLPSIFNDKEASEFLSAYGGMASGGLARGTRELFSVISQRETVFPVHQRSSVLEVSVGNRNIRAVAISPTPGAFALSVAHLAQYLPKKGHATPIRNVPEVHPNLEAIAIHIDLSDDAILLGADLEDHDRFGWSAVAGDAWCCSRTPASAYKVAHHGSSTGDTPRIWASLLTTRPTACLTPFIYGDNRLPTDDDRNRIRQNAGYAYISSGASRRSDMDSTQLRRLGQICKRLVRTNPGFGAVRLRKSFGAPTWKVDLFGDARPL